jgi:hypothetical protein
MARQCKVCSLENNLKSEVEKQLKDGVLPRLVASFLVNRGVSITTPSIDRHKKNCLGLTSFESLETDDLDESEGVGIDVIAVLSEAKTRFKSVQLDDSLKEGILLSTVLLSDILANQLAMLKIAQSKYIQGIGGYPKDLYRDLQVILNLRSSVSEDYRKTYSYNLKKEEGLIE